MPFIYNHSADEIACGKHAAPLPGDVLIQITDPCGTPPKPAKQFAEVHHYEFLDIEDNDYSMEEEWKFSDSQASEIVAILTKAETQQHNVFVHCRMGVARSGAVVEAALCMGFTDPETYRHPNNRVYKKLTSTYLKNYLLTR